MGLWVPKLRAEYIIEEALYQEALDYARRSRAYTSDQMCIRDSWKAWAARRRWDGSKPMKPAEYRPPVQCLSLIHI